MNIYVFLQKYFDTSFYYPNSAFVFFVFLLLLLTGTLCMVGIIWQKFLRDIVIRFIQEKTELLFIVLLFLMVFSRYSVTYLNTEQKQLLPDSIFAMDHVGRDWLDGLMQPAFSMLEGKPFNPAIGYGQALTAIAGMTVSAVQSIGWCAPSHIKDCSNIVYKTVFIFVFFGFFFVALLARYRKDIMPVLLVIIIFYLSIPGSLGLDRGNLDVVFSLVMYILVILRLRRKTQTVAQAIGESIVMSLFTSTKVTMLPFAVAFLLTSEYWLLSLTLFLGSFVGFSYMPFLLHRSGSLMDPIIAARAFETRYSDMFGLWCSPGNYVVYSTATYAIVCSKQAIAEHIRMYWNMVHVIGYMLFFFIAVWPLRLLMQYIWKKNFLDRLKIVFTRGRQGLFLLILCVGTASINLLPFLSYSYRLYFSLLCILAVWYAAKNKTERRAIILSSIFLLIKGLWIPDNRIMNIFVAFHYYYLITAAALILLRQII